MPVGKPAFQASVEGCGTPDTKVYADENMKVLWNADDRISIFNLNTFNGEFAFDGDDGDTAGGFEPVGDEGSGADIDYVYAAYPYRAETSFVTDGVLTMMLPAEQAYKAHSFGIGANTMMAVTDGQFLAFKNVGGYLSLRLYGDDVSVSRIVIQGNNGEKIAGKSAITMPLGGMPTVTMDRSATDAVSVVCDPPVKIGASATDYTEFWFVIPPVTFEKGFTITIMDVAGGTFTKSTSRSFTVYRNQLDWMYALKVEPEYSFWGILGGFNNWSSEGEIIMQQTAPGIWISPAFPVPGDNSDFKIRKNQDWYVNYGGEFKAFGTPFEVGLDGQNIVVGEEDYTIRVRLDLTTPSHPMVTVDKVPGWSVIGGFNSWAGDLAMRETAAGIWVSPEFTTVDEGGFKLRFDKEWDVNLGGTFSAFGTPLQGIYGGDCIMLGVEAEKTIWVQLDLTDPDNPVITVNEVVPPTVWSVIGEFSGWLNDLDMTEVSAGIWKSPVFTVPGGGTGFKVRKDHNWEFSFGGSFPGFGVSFEPTVNTDENIIVGESGKNFEVSVTLDLTDPDRPLITIAGYQETWCMIGSFSGWYEDVEMEEIEPGKWQGSLNNVDAWTEFKFRWNHDWNYAILGADSVSNETVAVTPGVPLNLANPGGNIRIEESGSYDVLLDFTGSSPVATVTLQP